MYVNTLKALVPCFFALNRTNYERWLPVHIKDALELKIRHPLIYKEFSNGCFTGQKSNKRFSFIALDQIHEQENLKVKQTGGAIPLLDKDNALKRWMLGAPEVTSILEDFEGLFKHTRTDLRDLHHDEGFASQMNFKRDVEKLVNGWESIGNPFSEEIPKLINIYSRSVPDDEVAECIFSLHNLGKVKYESFVNEVLVQKKKSFWDPIKQNKLKLFGSKTSSTSTSQYSSLKVLRKNYKMFQQLILNASSRGGNTGDFFSREPFEYPPSISNNGSLRFGNKSDIVKILLNHQQSTHYTCPAQISVKVFDAAAKVQSIKIPDSVKTFADYKVHFYKHIKAVTTNIARWDLIFDRYLSNSLKCTARAKRGSAAAINFKTSTPIPKSWHTFLSNSDNKTKLFKFLALRDDMVSFHAYQDAVVTDTEGVTVLHSSTADSLGIENIQPSNHEEADSRIFLHCLHASENGLKHVMIVTVDSDVVVLAVHFFSKLNVETLWIQFGVGKHTKFTAAHEISAAITSNVCSGLTFFHAFTGCDTVSAFQNHGKTSAWNTWRTYPQIGNVFQKLSEPADISLADLANLETFVIRMYDKESKQTSLDEARKQLVFGKACSPDQLPPTSASLKNHALRALYQAGMPLLCFL